MNLNSFALAPTKDIMTSQKSDQSSEIPATEANGFILLT